MAWKSFLKQLGVRQNSKPELVAFRVDVSDVSAVATSKDGLDEGSNYATILKNGTGDYTITFNRTSRRVPVVLGGAVVGEAFLRLQAEPTTSTVRVIIEADDGTNTDADFHLSVLQFFSQWER
jgi:hypothetical protein